MSARPLLPSCLALQLLLDRLLTTKGKTRSNYDLLVLALNKTMPMDAGTKAKLWELRNA